MATEERGAAPGLTPAAPLPRRAPSVADRLFAEPFSFDFFQAVRLLQRLASGRERVGGAGPPSAEAVLFRAHVALSFPPSTIHDLEHAGEDRPAPVLSQAFLGLVGPSGVLPRHYTELILRLERDSKDPEKRAFRDWLDLFHHRLTSLFYRAWELYRYPMSVERGDAELAEPDAFTNVLYSLIGLGMPPLRDRLAVAVRDPRDGRRQVLARVADLGLLPFAGLIAHGPPRADGLAALVGTYFQVPVEVRPFRGAWIAIEPHDRTRLGVLGGNGHLGRSAVAGARVWDAQGQFEVRIGPLDRARFDRFLPDREPKPQGKSFFLVAHLIRLYTGSELDFSIRLILRAAEVPACRLGTADEAAGVARLGRNAWLLSRPAERDAADAIFPGDAPAWVGDERPAGIIPGAHA
jgi:type VI secretion system protein ImpH